MAKFHDGLCNECISVFTSLWFPSTSIILRLECGVSMITSTHSFFLLFSKYAQTPSLWLLLG